MKRLLVLFMVALLVVGLSSWQGEAVVNNSTSSQTASDSITIPFFLSDSSGNPGLTILNGDTIHVTVYYPSGAAAYSGHLAYNDAHLVVTELNIDSTYALKFQVSEIDGSGVNGRYSYRLMVRDSSLHLWNPFSGWFELYTTRDWATFMDSTVTLGRAGLDTLQNHDNWVAKEASVARDTLLTIRDTSLSKSALDSLQAQDGWVAKEASVARDTLLTIRDTTISKGALDSLQAQDGWVAKEASVSRDTLISTAKPTAAEIRTAVLGDTSDVPLELERLLIDGNDPSQYATLDELKAGIVDTLGDTLIAKVEWLTDSLPLILGFRSRVANAWSIYRTDADEDTLWFGNCTNGDCTTRDTLGYVRYIHTGGDADGTPDSTLSKP